MFQKEKVQKISWTPKWDGGAPMPQVFSNGQKVYLIYFIADWDRESIQKIEELEDNEEGEDYLALVEFEGHTFRFGIANDEVFAGLPYYKQGIEWAQIIDNSKWIDEIKQIHKIHPRFDNDHWTNRKHYLLTFKDEILEVIAESYTIQVFKSTPERLGREVLERMNK
ncbi:hypothetical protein [Chryseosolibacter indicus]|uniref:Uncharacterized protein n=1 Tax=Chryseosolibacter indicus TaxID=2782351 RepID=A0ABS5VZL6_9BACT|nr:hypothetical protein [Chryseosolibacter indicus]MBT1706523.1 hypothetical protein [Chryseosolibacter indicus]